MTYLTNDLLIKSDLSSKISQFNEKIMSQVEEIFNNNNSKNQALKRYEGIYSKMETKEGEIEVYTYMSLFRPKDTNLNCSIITFLDPNYLEMFKFADFEYLDYKVILSVFNKLLFFDQKNKPLFIIDDINKVKTILCKIMSEAEIRKVSDQLSGDKPSVYDIEIVPEVLYLDCAYNKQDNKKTNNKVCLYFN